ncbi:MAG TPA: monovalent cation/H(+) antiporter subunit G [Candidatus Acidoferrales bacterium]|nr:monovalent cation/H(+) antiporter subunit G [Candidatus Acidoferrales bacterium]
MGVIVEVLTAILLISGAFFALTAGVGILRMPDFYSRAHPAGKSDTLAQTLILLGLALQALQHEELGWRVAVKLALIILFLFVTAPTAVHAITRAAHVDGLKVWTRDERSDE